MNHHLFCIVVLFSLPLGLEAQPQREIVPSSAISGVGVRIGYGSTFNYSKINDHVTLSAFADIAVGDELFVNIRGEYFRIERNSWSVSFRDLQTINEVRGPFSWSNATLGVGLLRRVTSLSALGAGVGLEWIKVHDTENIGASFVPNDGTSNDTYLNVGRGFTTVESFVCPSAYFMATLSWPMPGGIVIGSELQYKFSFVGKKYSQGALNSINTFGASFGVKYLLE